MYTLYLDESGDEGEYDINNGDEKGGSSRFFTLGGIIVEGGNIPNFQTRMNNIISTHFPDLDYFNKFKLHYFELREARYPFNNKSKWERRKIADDVFNAIKDIDCYLLSVTIDLFDHRNKYRNPVKPRAYSLILIKERFQYFLEERNSRGKVIYEEYDYDLRKQVQFGYNYLNQTNFSFHSNLDNIDGDVIDGDPLEEIVLQFADFAVYPAYRKCKSCNNEKRRFDEICHKYYNLDYNPYKSRRGNVHV